MSSGAVPSGGQPCGGCAGAAQVTPEAIANRPALASIAYRAGRYATFKASMLAALSDPAFHALAPLRTRDTADFSIALLDAWAVALDILTFYQERFANEAYLRTAADQRSVFELARLVGYAPSPGVAASAVLAFTLSGAPGSPDNVLIPAGSRVQSVPGPGQTAQIFETSADLTAVIGWNALPAQTTIRWQLAGSDTSTRISGTANNINRGDALLFVRAQDGQSAGTEDGQPAGTGPTDFYAGQPAAASGDHRDRAGLRRGSQGEDPPAIRAVGDFHYVTAVTPDPVSGNTQIWWDEPLSDAFTKGDNAGNVCLYAFRKKAALYGVQAPDPRTLSGPRIAEVPGYYAPSLKTAQHGDTPPARPGDTPPARQDQWIYQSTGRGNQINLDASYPGLAPPAAGPPQWVVLTRPDDTAFFRIGAVAETSPGYYTLTAKTTQLTLTGGQSVPKDSSFSASDSLEGGQSMPKDSSFSVSDSLKAFVCDTPNVTAYVQSVPLTPADLPLTAWSQSSEYPLEPGMLTPVSDSKFPVTGGQQIAAGQPVGVSGKCLRIQVSGGTFVPAGWSGGSEAAVGQVFVTGSFPPATDPEKTQNLLWTVTTVSGVPGTLSVPGDMFTLLPAAAADPQAGEAAVVQSVSVSGDIAILTLTSPLASIYDASTVTVNANAVAATNGHTIQEILGSGDAANPALQFTLKQGPLTYLPTPSGGGTQSTLQVWVNNLQWHETASLLTSGPADRVFVTSMNTVGHTVVQFGNGVHGARTPTGTANVRAVYRTGIGGGGMVSARQLTQPLDRPQGLSSVTNPGPASGAADPHTAGRARTSAPLPTLTVGRVISLEDYQNYALGFAGVAKALASWTWFGSVRGVFLTLAGHGGAQLGSTDPVITGLAGAISLCSDPHVPLQLVSYVPVLFTFNATVVVDQANYDPGQVLAQVWQQVSAAFAFDQRRLGQDLAASEIIQVIQQVAGVTAVQLQALAPSGAASQDPSPAILRASGPRPPAGAQLLQLDPATQGRIGVWSP